MDLKLDENTLWVLGILALVFFIFPQKNKKVIAEKVEEEKEIEYIYKRKDKERRRLVY
ncbi:MAG: hypothetical protein K0S75_571 [Clostridia bacterium]|nr:hypothetical protein [Clostridia bacterium]